MLVRTSCQGTFKLFFHNDHCTDLLLPEQHP